MQSIFDIASEQIAEWKIQNTTPPIDLPQGLYADNPVRWPGPAAKPALQGKTYPWIGDGSDSDAYDVWFGSGDADFADSDTAAIEKFQMLIGSTPNFKFTINDTDPDNDGMFFDKGDGNQVQILWATPRIQLLDNSDNGIRIDFADGSPVIHLADVWDAPSSGNQIKLDLAVGPEVLLTDDGGNSLSVDINNGPQVYLLDSEGNTALLDINEVPELSLTNADGSSAFLGTDIFDLTGADGAFAELNPANLTLTDSEGSYGQYGSGIATISDQSSGDTITLDASTLDGHSIYAQEISVCIDNGDGTFTNKKVMALVSDPYT